jgi:hypothetical protein
LSGKKQNGGNQKSVRAWLRRKLPATKQKNVQSAKPQPQRRLVVAAPVCQAESGAFVGQEQQQHRLLLQEVPKAFLVQVWEYDN